MLIKKEKAKEGKEASFFSFNEKKKRNVKKSSASSINSCDSTKSNYSSCYLNAECFLKNITICKKCIFSYFDFENVTKVIYMRHGARTPKKKIRNIWPFIEGKGDLTFLGFQQSIKIGKYLRKYYYSLRKLNRKYNNKYNKNKNLITSLNKWIYKNNFLKLIKEKKKINFLIKINQNKKRRKKIFKILIHKNYFFNYKKSSYSCINNIDKQIKLKNVIEQKSKQRNSNFYKNNYTNFYKKKKINNNDNDKFLEKIIFYYENILTNNNIFNNSKEKENFLDIIKNMYLSKKSFLNNVLRKCKIDIEKKKYDKIIKLINKYLCIKTTNSERCKLTAYAIICGILGISKKMFFFFFLLSFDNDYEYSNSLYDKIKCKSKNSSGEKRIYLNSFDLSYTTNNNIYEKEDFIYKDKDYDESMHKIKKNYHLTKTVKLDNSIYHYYLYNIFKNFMNIDNYKLYNDTNNFECNNVHKSLHLNFYDKTQNVHYNCKYKIMNNSIIHSNNNINHVYNNDTLNEKRNYNYNINENLYENEKNISYIMDDFEINNNTNNAIDDSNIFRNKSNEKNISTLNFNDSNYKEKSDFVNKTMNYSKYFKKRDSKNFFLEKNTKSNFMKSLSHSDNIISGVANFKNLEKKSLRKMNLKFNISYNLMYNMNVFFEFVMNNKNNTQFFYSKIKKTKHRNKRSLEKSYIYYVFQIYLQYILNKFINHIINNVPSDNRSILSRNEDKYFLHSLKFEEGSIPVYINKFCKTIYDEKYNEIDVNKVNVGMNKFNRSNNNNNNNIISNNINNMHDYNNSYNVKNCDFNNVNDNNNKTDDYINNKPLGFDKYFNNIYNKFIEKYNYLLNFLNYINLYIRFFFYYLKNVYVLCSVVKVAERNSLMFKTLKAKNQYIKKLKNHIFNNSKLYKFLNNYYKEEISIVYYITKWKGKYINTREILLKDECSIYTPNVYLNNSILSTFKKHISSIYKLKRKLNNSIILRDLRKLNYSSVNTNFLNIQNYEQNEIHNEKKKNWRHFFNDKRRKIKNIKIIKKFISSYDAYVYHNVNLFFDFNNAYKKLSKEDSSDTMTSHEGKVNSSKNIYFFNTFQANIGELENSSTVSPKNISTKGSNEKRESINSYIKQEKNNTFEEKFTHMIYNKDIKNNELKDDNKTTQEDKTVQLNEKHDDHYIYSKDEKYKNSKKCYNEIYKDKKECCKDYISFSKSELITLSLNKENELNKDKFDKYKCDKKNKIVSCGSFPIYEKEKKKFCMYKNLNGIIKGVKNEKFTEKNLKYIYKTSKYFNISKKKKKNKIKKFYKNVYECYKLMCKLEYNNKYLSWLCSGMSLIDVAINFIINVRLFEKFQKKKKKKKFIPKIILYLTHQSALLSFQSCLGIKINNMKIPPFAGFISLELIRIKKRKIKRGNFEYELYNNCFNEGESNSIDKKLHTFATKKNHIFTESNSKNINSSKILNYINKNDTANIFCCKEDCVWKVRKKKKKNSLKNINNYKNCKEEIEKVINKKKEKRNRKNKYNDKYESFLPKCSNKIQDFKNLFFLLCYKDNKIEDLIELYNLCLSNDYTHIKNVHLMDGKKKRKRYFYGYFIKFTFNNYFPLKLKKKKSIRKYNIDKKKEDKFYNNNFQEFQENNCAVEEKKNKYCFGNQKEKKYLFKKNNIINREVYKNEEKKDSFNNIEQNDLIKDNLKWNENSIKGIRKIKPNEKKYLINPFYTDLTESENNYMQNQKNFKEKFQNEHIKLHTLKNQNINKNEICSKKNNTSLPLVNNFVINKKIKKNIMKKLNMNNFNFNCKYDKYMNYIYNSKSIKYSKNYHKINKNTKIKFTTKKSDNINSKLLSKYKIEKNENTFLFSEEGLKDERDFRKSKFKSLKIKEQGDIISQNFEKLKKQDNSYNMGYCFRLNKKNISKKVFKNTTSNKYIKKNAFFKRKGEKIKTNYENENMICLDCFILYLKKMLSIYGNPEML
ncbi:conserved Plasmodium protein, unknown function [Plasmodium relictum]|uniref:Uncharacterized protein n=1 Tax=Plasmodium relictum TaxID=85471 RepID=A0A1J1H1K0_PLARL|nr:conserved Plasmodium protein, unknown function [Plasmodium relictum]CRG98792.1 conserved Plasmodium protein, unknown function [Plasmodium relictum]